MGRGLPKKYAKMGFAKGWREYKKTHSYKKVYKGGKSSSKSVRKTTKRRSYRKKSRRKPKHKIPLEVAVALGAIPFTPCSEWGAGIIPNIQAENPRAAAREAVHGFIGVDIDYPQGLDVFRTLNPLDFGVARYTKILIMAGIISKFRKSLVKIPMDKIPFIGKYIS